MQLQNGQDHHHTLVSKTHTHTDRKEHRFYTYTNTREAQTHRRMYTHTHCTVHMQDFLLSSAAVIAVINNAGDRLWSIPPSVHYTFKATLPHTGAFALTRSNKWPSPGWHLLHTAEMSLLAQPCDSSLRSPHQPVCLGTESRRGRWGERRGMEIEERRREGWERWEVEWTRGKRSRVERRGGKVGEMRREGRRKKGMTLAKRWRWGKSRGREERKEEEKGLWIGWLKPPVRPPLPVTSHSPLPVLPGRRSMQQVLRGMHSFQTGYVILH